MQEPTKDTDRERTALAGYDEANEDETLIPSWISTVQGAGDRAHELLMIFGKVRERLHREGGITSLSLDFPIRELNDDHYMGMTFTQHGGWKEVCSGRRIAAENIVHSIGIRLRYQNSSKCYDLQTLLATLLHEFAHAITRGEMQYGHTEEGRRCRGWHDVAHTDEFYSNFALILERAEALGIFTLPGDPRSKFTKKYLIKYDYIDSQKNDLRGEIEDEPEDKSVPPFMLPDADDEKKEREESQVDEPLRLTLCRKGQRKMVMLQPRTMNQLLLLVQQKFRTKPHSIKDSKGNPLKVDADLKMVGQDAVLQIT